MPPPIANRAFPDNEVHSAAKTPLRQALVHALKNKKNPRKNGILRKVLSWRLTVTLDGHRKLVPGYWKLVPVDGYWKLVPADRPHARKPWGQSVWLWRAVVTTLVTFAVIPGIAGISASVLSPYTVVCLSGPPKQDFTANIIAENNGWAYLIEYHRNVEKNKQVEYFDPYFRLVPLSSVAELNVGYRGTCIT